VKWEQCLIGTVVDDPKTIYEAYTVVPQDFTENNHDIIWKAILELYGRGTLSKRSLIELLRDQGELGSIGDEPTLGADYIEYLVSLSDTLGVKEYASQVIDKASKRRLEQLGALLIRNVNNGRLAEEIIEDHIKEILKLRREGVKNPRPVGELVPGFDEKSLSIREGKLSPFWIPQIDAVKHVVRHMTDVDFQIIVGKTGTGKSSMLRYEGLQTALKESKGVLTITLENSEEECLTWGIAMLSGIDHLKVINPKLQSDEDEAAIEDAKQLIKTIPWYVLEMGIAHFENIAGSIRKFLLSQNGIALIQVDGMYLMRGSYDSRYEVIASNAQGLRSLAQEIHIPIQGTTQFNRGVKDKREPEVDDLLYAGEMPARQIISITKDEMTPNIAGTFPENNVNGIILHGDRAEACLVTCNVLKNTSGKIGKTDPIKWIKSTNTYQSLERDYASKSYDQYIKNREVTDKIMGTYPRDFTPAPKPEKKKKN